MRAKKNTEPDSVKEWFCEKEAAVYLGMPVDSLKRMRYKGQIRFGQRRGGKSITYKRADLDKAIEDNFSFYDAVPVDANAGRFRNYK